MTLGPFGAEVAPSLTTCHRGRRRPKTIDIDRVSPWAGCAAWAYKQQRDVPREHAEEGEAVSSRIKSVANRAGKPRHPERKRGIAILSEIISIRTLSCLSAQGTAARVEAAATGARACPACGCRSAPQMYVWLQAGPPPARVPS